MEARKPSEKPINAPEPCFGGVCRSPNACSDWGYCRERNQGRAPSREMVEVFRDAAKLCSAMAAEGKTP